MRASGFLAVALAAVSVAQADVLVKSGDKISFLGDSITQRGNWPCGYVNLVMEGLKTLGIDAVKSPAGIGGNKSNHMRGRVDNDCLRGKPQFMTLSCGVNDVWHSIHGTGIPLEEYKKNICEILDKAAASNVTAVVLTATMIYEDPNNDLNQKLIPYNEFLRAEAKARNLPLADLNAKMQAKLAEIRKTDTTKGNKLTCDGVHMAWPGDCLMAEGVLAAFGVPESEFPKIRAAWEVYRALVDVRPCQRSRELRISVLGDSYSTYKDWIPKGNAIWYPNNDVRDVQFTWWSRVISAIPNARLECNESWSGSTVCTTGYRGEDFTDRAFINRVDRLGAPDIILICGATNDSWAGAPIGAYKWENWTVEDLKTFRPAMAKLLNDVKARYPRAAVHFMLNAKLKAEINDSVHEACRHYGVNCIDLMPMDLHNAHPTRVGMKTIADQVLAAIDADVKAKDIR